MYRVVCTTAVGYPGNVLWVQFFTRRRKDPEGSVSYITSGTLGGFLADGVVAPAPREVLPPFLSHTTYYLKRTAPKIHDYKQKGVQGTGHRTRNRMPAKRLDFFCLRNMTYGSSSPYGPTFSAVPLSAGPRSSAVKISCTTSCHSSAATALRWDLHGSKTRDLWC